jgi:dihydropteroate synthase
MSRSHLHFVTGRLAEISLRTMVADLAGKVGFDYSIEVLPITVAALMTPQWIARHWHVPAAATEIWITGYCEGDLHELIALAGRPVVRGPRDLRQLPQAFGHAADAAEYGAYDIEIIAEINHAPRLALAEILRQATHLRDSGADVIDVGCQPGETWAGVGAAVRALCDAGHRVSIDSLNIVEIADAAAAGAELVLSVDRTNRHAAADWGIEVVAIPDLPGTLDGLDDTLAELSAANVPFRVDPILEPIGYGFAASLERCFEVRRRMPEAPMMLGIGNLTELTDVDSAGVNVVLLAICQELRIHSVLTTEVINWARTSVRECDLARRLVYHAVAHRTLPKHVEPRLVALRDPQLLAGDAATLERLANTIKDNNYRVFAEDGLLHLVSAQMHLANADPFALFDELRARGPKNLDASHSFYLGYELAKAAIALALSKNYRQDEALDWGYLTVPETSHRLSAKSPPAGDAGEGSRGKQSHGSVASESSDVAEGR